MIRRAIALVFFLSASAALHHCHAADDAQWATAIRQASQQYVAAMNRGDGESVAAFWSPQGDLIDTQGRRTNGRDLARSIQPGQMQPAAGMMLTIDTLRLISPD